APGNRGAPPFFRREAGRAARSRAQGFEEAGRAAGGGSRSTPRGRRPRLILTAPRVLAPSGGGSGPPRSFRAAQARRPHSGAPPRDDRAARWPRLQPGFARTPERPPAADATPARKVRARRLARAAK